VRGRRAGHEALKEKRKAGRKVRERAGESREAKAKGQHTMKGQARGQGAQPAASQRAPSNLIAPLLLRTITVMLICNLQPRSKASSSSHRERARARRGVRSPSSRDA
jgi:hypothetical protein